MGIILDAKKTWIKGNSTDTSIKDPFKAEYGEEAHLWLETINATEENLTSLLKFMVGSSMRMKRGSTLALLLLKEPSTKGPTRSQ